jgi:Transposase DDE domain
MYGRITPIVPGAAFTLQPDGTLRCPANHPLYPQERRAERDGSYRLLYAARIGDCRACPLRAQCQESLSTTKPRRVSAVFWPVPASQARASPAVLPTLHPPPPSSELAPHSPVLWGDWPRSQLRRRWMKVTRSEMVLLTRGAPPPEDHSAATDKPVITRAQRAHWRLSWEERLARNASPPSAPLLTVTLHGLPATFAKLFGFGLVNGA